MFDDSDGDEGLGFAVPEPDGGLYEQVAAEAEAEQPQPQQQQNEAPFSAAPPPRKQVPPSYRQNRGGRAAPQRYMGTTTEDSAPYYTTTTSGIALSPKIKFALAFAAGVAAGCIGMYAWEKYQTVRKNPWFKAANAARSMFS